MDGSSELDETSRLTFSKVFLLGGGRRITPSTAACRVYIDPWVLKRDGKERPFDGIISIHFIQRTPPPHRGWIINHHICCRVPPFCQRPASTDETTFCLFTVSLVAMFVRISQPKKISPFSCQLRDGRQKGFNTLSSHSRNSLKQCWALDCVHSGHLRAAAAHQELRLANLEARWRSDVTLAAE